MWPSMVTHTWNLCSAFNPSKCTHTAVNTHHEHTSGAVGSQCCGARAAVGDLVPCSRVSPHIEGGESAVHSLPPPTIPAGPQTRTKSNSLSIRPRLPPNYDFMIYYNIYYDLWLMTLKVIILIIKRYSHNYDLLCCNYDLLISTNYS